MAVATRQSVIGTALPTTASVMTVGSNRVEDGHGSDGLGEKNRLWDSQLCTKTSYFFFVQFADLETT